MSNINNFDLVSGTDILNLQYEDSFIYDASSFYNYEEDNLPLVKLFGRTDLLHQFAGFPGKNGTQVTMTLSSIADHSIGVYDNLEDIVQRIPQRLTFPLLIELCDYGNLGSLNLDGISTVGEGKLHIRNMLHEYDGLCTATSVVSVAASPVGNVASPEVIQTTTVRDNFESASSVRTGSNLFDNSRFLAGEGRMFVTKSVNTEEETDRLHFYTDINFDGVVGASNDISGIPYTSSIDRTIVSDDFIAREKGGTGTELETSRNAVSISSPSNAVSMNLYGNFFTSVTVRNCHGMVKLTGVCVDGASGDDSTATSLVHNTVRGIDIISSDILLEHTASVRCREAGIMFRNSEVGILGSCIGYRVYERDNGFTRVNTENSIGLHSINSTLTFLDEALGVPSNAVFNRFTLAFSRNDIGIKLENSKLRGGVRVISGKGNAGGLDLTTSVLQVYHNIKQGLLVEDSDVQFLGRIDSFNNLDGVSLMNSALKSPQFTFDDNQGNGIVLSNSILEYGYRLDELPSADRLDGTAGASKNKGSYHVSNNGVNLRAVRNSQVLPYYTGLSSLPSYIGLWSGHNGGASYGGAMTNHGSKTGVLYDEPSFIISDNSTIEILNAAFKADSVAPVRGRCAHITSNSKAIFRGTSTSRLVASLLPDNSGNFTVGGLNDSFQSAAFCAERNSEVELTGPVKIGRFGVAVLAEGNSIATIQTPLTDGGTTPNTFKYDLTDSLNQTKVELHSTRSCLVVNKNSTLNLKNIGGKPSSPSTTTDVRFNDASWSDSDLSSVWVDVQDSSYIQFYPNPFTSSIVGNGFHEATVASNFDRSTRLIASGSEKPMTGGGMVVRAVQGSHVDIDTVNFNFSMPASSVSGVISNISGIAIEGSGGLEFGTAVNASDKGYLTVVNTPQGTDPYTGKPLFDSGGSKGYTMVFSAGTAIDSYSPSGYVDPCSGFYDPSSMGTRIQIWNIADNSRITGSNVRINNGDPEGISQLSGYHGPFGKWPNGVALDYFGKFGAATTYNGDNAFRNNGIFRLMMGHRPDLKTMYAASADQSNSGVISIGRDTGGYPIDQINSQGYMNITMDASAIPNSDSRRIIGYDGGSEVEGRSLSGYEDIHGFGVPSPGAGTPGLLFPSMVAYHVRNLDTSGTYLMSSVPAMTPGPPHMDSLGFMRNFLDDSASNLFSNAKHLSFKKINGVSIYRSTNGPGGEGRDGDIAVDTFGVGIRSLNMFDLGRLM